MNDKNSRVPQGLVVDAAGKDCFKLSNPPCSFQVVESFKYEGTGGKVSQKTTTVGVVGGYTGTFTQ
ncbi:MAG: hypothetical protein QXN56_06730, partial [Candidatus Hadarchaeum sp.]